MNRDEVPELKVQGLEYLTLWRLQLLVEILGVRCARESGAIAVNLFLQAGFASILIGA